MHDVIELSETHIESPGSERRLDPKPSRLTLAIYALTVFVSAALLFQVQFIFAKHVLPFFGGAPSVWNTCMFCFQVLLLLGYGYAHFLKTRLTIRQQVLLHSVLLAVSAVVLVVLWGLWGTPLTPGAAWRPNPNDNPVLKILQLLGVTAAFPFFILSTTGPLLQSWAAQTRNLSSPYRLYALSNAGSLIGLLAYPFLLEWAFTVRHQAWIWASTYLLFVVLCCVAALLLPRESIAAAAASTHARVADRPTRVRYCLWLAFSTCSTVVLLASTNFLCENIAAVPLLWVLPLSIYLLTFMLAFSSHRWYSRKVCWPLFAAALGIVLSFRIAAFLSTSLLLIALYTFAIFAVCMVCHGELARSKPTADHLTSFYWMIACGGALGGTFVVLIAPKILHNFWEFQGALFACGLLLFVSAVLEDRSGRSEATAWTAILVVIIPFLIPYTTYLFPPLNRVPFLSREYWALPICLTLWLLWRAAFPAPAPQESASAKEYASGSTSQFAWQPIAAVLSICIFGIIFFSYVGVRASRLVYVDRNFFGVKYVSKSTQGLVFVSGNTVHGLQPSDPAQHFAPTLYFSPTTGVGALMNSYPREANGGHLRIGVIGMGIASLSAYARPGDFLRFYEIDPAVVGLSLGPRPIFSLLQHSGANTTIILGDARLSLERELALGERQLFDILVMDAFTSDAVPVHLITREALDVYLQHLRGPESVLVVNITNVYLDLCPVIRGLAQSRGLAIAQVSRSGANWMLLSRDPDMLRLRGLGGVALPPADDRPAILWTDDYSNVFRVLRHVH